MKTVLSGIQPSGQLTIGNYIGALQNFVKLQNDHNCYFMIVDLHAITVAQDPAALREQSEAVAALYIAAGIDPKKSNIFMQSHVNEHAELGWLMTTLSYMGELERMTQFKDKATGKGSIPTGLFVYPALMAADILLYNADIVPVGDDQKQHLELTRDLAQRFNQRYGDTFIVPEPYIPQMGARVMSLDDASKKMSKSNPNVGSYIAMLDEPDVIRKKISRATTDSEREVRFAPSEKPELSNLISIYALVTGRSVQSIEEQYAGGPGYGPFKKDLAEAVVACLEPLQQRYREIRQSGQVHDVLAQGAAGARERAATRLNEVKNKMGFLPPLRR